MTSSIRRETSLANNSRIVFIRTPAEVVISSSPLSRGGEGRKEGSVNLDAIVPHGVAPLDVHEAQAGIPLNAARIEQDDGDPSPPLKLFQEVGQQVDRRSQRRGPDQEHSVIFWIKLCQ